MSDTIIEEPEHTNEQPPEPAPPRSPYDAIFPKLESLHARQAARSMARLIDAMEHPVCPTAALESILHEMKETLCLDGISRVPALLTMQSHVLDILFNHMVQAALDGQSKRELLGVALRCQKQAKDVAHELARLKRDEAALAAREEKREEKRMKRLKNRQTDYYEDGFTR